MRCSSTSSIAMRISADGVTPATPLANTGVLASKSTPDLTPVATAETTRSKTRGENGRTLLQMLFQATSAPAVATTETPPTVSCFEKRDRIYRMVSDMLQNEEQYLGAPFSDVIKGKGARRVGNGQYASVYAIEMVGDIRPLVCKSICHVNQESIKAMDDEVKVELAVTAIFTDEFLAPGSAFNVPNFCAMHGFDITMRPLQFKLDPDGFDMGDDMRCKIVSHDPVTEAALLRENRSGTAELAPRVHSQMYLENCSAGTLQEHLRVLAGAALSRARGRLPSKFIESEELALVGSVCAQVLCAIAAAGAVQVSHNDLTLNNIFVRNASTDAGSVMQYQLSSKKHVLTVPLGRATPLVVLGDFGIASINNWYTDWRAKATTARSVVKPADMPTLPQRYYHAQEEYLLHRGKLTTLKLHSKARPNGYATPMVFLDLGPYERDMATFLSGINNLMTPYEAESRAFATDSPLRWCRLLHEFSEEALALLSQMRPKCYVDQVVFIHELFRRSELFSSWLGAPDPELRVANVARLPRTEEGNLINQRLLRTIGSKLRPDVRYIPATFDMMDQLRDYDYDGCDGDSNGEYEVCDW